MQVGDQYLVRFPATTARDIHKGRIGRLVSLANGGGFCPIEFSDGSQISFYAKEIELVTTPTALSRI